MQSSIANASVGPPAVMIHEEHASIAYFAVMHLRCLDCTTLHASLAVLFTELGFARFCCRKHFNVLINAPGTCLVRELFCAIVFDINILFVVMVGV